MVGCATVILPSSQTTIPSHNIIVYLHIMKISVNRKHLKKKKTYAFNTPVKPWHLICPPPFPLIIPPRPPCPTYQTTVDSLSVGLLHLPQLRDKVPEARFSHHVVRSEDPHAIERRGWVLHRGQEAPNDFVLPKLCGWSRRGRTVS